ncbi:hypothetical protein WDU94_005363 [Cyamophila willieti]
MLTIENMIKIKRLRWAGHLSRMDESRTPHQVTFSELKVGKRAQKKPKKRWIDVLKQDLKEQRINNNEWRNLAADRKEWRIKINENIVNYQERNIREAKSKRQEKYENEDQFIWECPLCDFKREGRKGRQYVNSHLTQAHRDITEEVRQNTNNTLECTLCNTICDSRAGLSSHMRHRHPSHIPPENRFRPTRRTLTQDQPSTSQVQSNQSAQYASTSQASQVLPVNTNNQFNVKHATDRVVPSQVSAATKETQHVEEDQRKRWNHRTRCNPINMYVRMYVCVCVCVCVWWVDYLKNG